MIQQKAYAVPIVGYSELYSVDNNGNIFSFEYKKFLKTNIKEYVHVTLYKNGQPKTHLLHRIIAEAFLLNPDNLPEVNHKNGNKLDNSIENLEWITKSGNAQHAMSLGLLKSRSGESNGNAKISEKDVKYIRSMAKVKSQSQIAKELNISQTLVSQVQMGKIWKHV